MKPLHIRPITRFKNIPQHRKAYLLGILLLTLSLFFISSPALATSTAFEPEQIPYLFVDLLENDDKTTKQHLETINKNWTASMVPMAVEVLRFSRSRKLKQQLIDLLSRKTGQNHSYNINDWYQWWWSLPEQRHPYYGTFKSLLYRQVDPRFEYYFSSDRATIERLDEIRWGGVKQDGIPPLRQPRMIDAAAADYLADSDVIFGVEIKGDARAYPKRILAWHEMFVDTIGGTEFAGVYCTLCGAVILYETTLNGTRHEVGTSGFLFRSNKVMYDKKTQSLWNTTRGEPIVGPLVGQGIQLERSFLVTSTWGEWRKRHPDTTVLSLKTGYRRNYDEGEAYRNYFASDELMFTVPKKDQRLPNKAEVLALYFPKISDKTLAIHSDYLVKKPVYHHTLDSQPLVVFTDTSGANRVYDATDVTFSSYDGDSTALDQSGNKWTLKESQITNGQGETRERLAAHRAFWFGWFATFNDTELVY